MINKSRAGDLNSFMGLSAAPLHALHQCHLIRRGGDVEGGGLSLVDATFDPIYRLLLFHLHCVAQTQCAEKQLLTLLWRKNKGVTHTHISSDRHERNLLTLDSGPGDVSIISIPAAPGITCQRHEASLRIFNLQLEDFIRNCVKHPFLSHIINESTHFSSL